MEMTKEKVDILRSYIGKEDFYDLNGTPILSKILSAMQDFADQQTTSQKETIERLRESLQNVTSSLIAHIGSERAKEWLEVQQAEQLLNTTEPIDQ